LIGRRKCISHSRLLLFADDQIIIQESEDELQRSIFYVNNICKSFNLKIPINKTKTMAFKGKCPVRTKIVTEDKYLGYDVTFLEETDMTVRLKNSEIYVALLGEHLKEKSGRIHKQIFSK
jgi:hypothetical protein